MHLLKNLDKIDQNFISPNRLNNTEKIFTKTFTLCKSEKYKPLSIK